MRIVVDDVAADPNSGGVYSILSDLYMDVLKSEHKNKWFFILAGKYFPENDHVKIIERPDLKKSKIKKLCFELLTGRALINKLKPDVYISLQNIITNGIKTKTKIVYLQQPLPFENQKSFSFFKKRERKLAFYQKFVGLIIKSSIHFEKPVVIVQTQWMKKAVGKRCSISPTKIIIKHPKVNKNNSELYEGDGKTFFYPASNYLYKNHEVIFRASNLLVKNGINDFKINLTLKKNQLPYHSKNVSYIGHISRKEVLKKYTKEVLIFPSYIESFGLPLIEAALQADIILVADTDFSRELLNNYSNTYFFEYRNPKALANLMKKVINQNIVSNHKALTKFQNGESLLCSIRKILCDIERLN